MQVCKVLDICEIIMIMAKMTMIMMMIIIIKINGKAIPVTGRGGP
jgi:hypothetical protein